MRWVNTVETATEVEQVGGKGQWRIGDAIIKDLKENNVLENSSQEGDPPTIKSMVFADCAKKLAEKGIEHNGRPYAGRYVRDLFQAAFFFPRDARNPKYSWDAHNEAGTPVNLKKAATALGKMEKKVTMDSVRSLISHWAEGAKTERKKKKTAASDKKQKATAKKKKITEELLKTDPKDAAAREELQKQLQALREEIAEAKKTIRENSGTPPVTDLDVDTDDVSALKRWAIYMGITAHTMVMKREAKKTLDDVKKLSNDLSDYEQQTIADSCNEIIGILEQINELVKHPVRKLVGIQGGKP